jgi:hypothetical protein
MMSKPMKMLKIGAMQEIEMGNQFFPQVEIDRIVYEGFASSGWVVTSSRSLYVEGQQRMTGDKKYANVFKNLCTAPRSQYARLSSILRVLMNLK